MVFVPVAGAETDREAAAKSSFPLV